MKKINIYKALDKLEQQAKDQETLVDRIVIQTIGLDTNVIGEKIIWLDGRDHE